MPASLSRFLLAALSALSLLLLSSCSDEPAPLSASPALVVEGWIDSDGFPEVLLGRSVVPDAAGGDFADYIVRWGKVTISDGTSEVILTGGPSDKFFPPYHYYTHEMRGVPGRTYTLTASYAGLTATSTVTMPPAPTPIASIDISPVEGIDTLRHLTLTFRTPSDAPAYYHISAQVKDIDMRPLPSMLGSVEAIRPGELVSVPVYRGNSSLVSGSFTPDFPVGATVRIDFARVSPEAFLFWKAFDSASLVAGSVFISSPGSLPSNISGGLGIWSPRAVTTQVITIP